MNQFKFFAGRSIFLLVLSYLFVITLLAILVIGVYILAPEQFGLQLETVAKYVFFAWSGLFCLLPVFILAWSRHAAVSMRMASGIGEKEQASKKKTSLSVLAGLLDQHLHSTYGTFWKSKVTFVLLCGQADLVEQVAPGLSSQRWLEADGRVLLWAGEQVDAMDAEIVQALTKLRRRPLDALVLVTNAWQQPDTLDMPGPVAGLEGEQLASIRRGVRACFRTLGWSVPLYVWSLHGSSKQPTELVSCLLPAQASDCELERRLQILQPALVTHGTESVLTQPGNRFLLALAGYLAAGGCRQISQELAGLLTGPQALPLAGVLLSSGCSRKRQNISHVLLADARWNVFFTQLARLPQGLRPQRHGWRSSGRLQAGIVAAAVLVAAGMLLSYTINRQHIQDSALVLHQLQNPQQSVTQRLEALARLQQQIGRLQYQQDSGIALWQRLGFSQHDNLLRRLWPVYAEHALVLLRDPAASRLLARMQQLAAAAPDSQERQALAQPVYQSLKAYLMLSRPERMEAGFFTDTSMEVWSQPEAVDKNQWQRLGPELLLFYASQLPRHADWLLPHDEPWIEQTRALLVRDMGNRNSDSALYQAIIEQISPQYAELWLGDLTADTDFSTLFVSGQSVPGVYTRQAWENAVRPAIAKAGHQRDAGFDWVLSDNRSVIESHDSAEDLQQRLTALYFSGFARSWQRFLNSLQWRQADSLADTVEQLTLMTDQRQSPLLALMDALAWQAAAGREQAGLKDVLVSSARDLLASENLPAGNTPNSPDPLAPLFGPVLELLEPGRGEAGSEHLSFQRYLSMVSRTRLKLQQVLNAPDPQAMSQTLAQSLFQGRSSDFADSRDYAHLVAASLGQELGGFAESLLVQPLEQAWQQLLHPAMQGMNRQWQRAVVDDWQQAFVERYPLWPTQADSSLPLYARYLRGDGGRIEQFLSTELQGVLRRDGNRWVAGDNAGYGLQLNPEFLQALETVGMLGDVLFARGDARLQFELRPETAAGLMQVQLTVDGQTLNYRNEMPRWFRFTWPGDTLATGARLSWRSEDTGLRQYADFSGSWGLIRLLEQAEVSEYPGLPGSYRVRWTAADGLPLSFIMRTEYGEGPLALLKLRGFNLPQQVFLY